MSFSSFYIVHVSNEHYIDHHLRTQQPATGGHEILPYHIKQDSPCDHNLPTPCPPSTPILVQITNSGRPNNVSVHTRSTEDQIQRLHQDLLNTSAIKTLNMLNDSPAVESVSPSGGSRKDHSFYKCRLCPNSNTHIMNIGATLHHITHIHATERYDNKDKLTLEAFGHLTEIRHLLRQTNDRRVFTIIRSSSDSIPIINWKNISSHSNSNSTMPAKERTSSLGHPPEERQQPSKIQLPNRPPTYRNTKVHEVSTTVQRKIDAGLSLDLSNLFQTTNNRLDYAERITGNSNTPNKKTNDPESPTITNSTPNTRNGGVRKGIFDKNHNFRRFRS